MNGDFLESQTTLPLSLACRVNKVPCQTYLCHMSLLTSVISSQPLPTIFQTHKLLCFGALLWILGPYLCWRVLSWRSVCVLFPSPLYMSICHSLRLISLCSKYSKRHLPRSFGYQRVGWLFFMLSLLAWIILQVT